MTVLRLICLVIALGLPSLGWGFSMDKLIDLHNTGNAQATYEYAAQHFADMAGDPTFDYYYGVAAINTGHASQGVFALERVIAIVPQNLAARIELARGYFILEEYARSRAEFELALSAEPPVNVRAKINRYLSAISNQEGRYQTTTIAYGEVGAGHNDNVNNAPEDVSDTDIALDNPAIDDDYAVFAAGFHINTPVAPGRSLFGGGDLDYSMHADESDFNTGNLRINGGISIFDDTHRYRFLLRARRFYFDGDAYRNTTALLGEWRVRSSQSRRLNLFGQIGRINYPDQSVRDASAFSIGGGVTQNTSGWLSPVYFGSVFAGKDDAEENSDTARSVAERSFSGIQAGVQLTVSASIRLVNKLSIVASRYAKETVLATASDRKREDDLYQFTSQLIWLISDAVSLRGKLKYTDNQSNIDALEYDGLSADVRLRYDFN